MSDYEPKWSYTDDPTDPCDLCIQWRPVNTDDEFADQGPFEPYLPDGSVVPRLCRTHHPECEQMVADYMAEVEEERRQGALG